MADLRIPSATPPAVRPPGAGAPAKAEAVRAAQRAFFDAALGATVAAPAPSTPTKPAAVAATQAVGAQPTTLQPSPGRLLRPGSFVDVKV